MFCWPCLYVVMFVSLMEWLLSIGSKRDNFTCVNSTQIGH